MLYSKTLLSTIEHEILRYDFLKPAAWRFDTGEDVLSSAADDASVFGWHAAALHGMSFTAARRAIDNHTAIITMH